LVFLILGKDIKQVMASKTINGVKV